MNNERIDLTQFEEMEDARPWHASWYPAEEGVEPDFLIDGGTDGYKVRIVNTQGGVALAYIRDGNKTLAKQIAKLPDLIAELKRCYELIDAMNGNVPYVEHCEDCGATDGGEAEGCDYCGIIHYQSRPRGFYHKDSPKR